MLRKLIHLITKVLVPPPELIFLPREERARGPVELFKEAYKQGPKEELQLDGSQLFFKFVCWECALGTHCKEKEKRALALLVELAMSSSTERDREREEGRTCQVEETTVGGISVRRTVMETWFMFSRHKTTRHASEETTKRWKRLCALFLFLFFLFRFWCLLS